MSPSEETSIQEAVSREKKKPTKQRLYRADLRNQGVREDALGERARAVLIACENKVEEI